MSVLPFAVAGAAEPASEEIVVYADDFARWDHTRWLVRSELLLPGGLVLSAEENASFRTHALQVRAVVACDKDAKLSAKRWEVSCTLEDVGLLVTTQAEWRTERGRERVAAVLREVDAKLTGAEVQMQADRDGSVVNFDVEGLQSDNERERQIQETFRTLVNMVMAGFDLASPDHGQRDGQFTERHTELFDVPSLTAARASALVVHQASPWKDAHRLVQTVAEGTVAVALPVVGTDLFHQAKLLSSDTPIVSNLSARAPSTSEGGGGGGGIGSPVVPSFPPPADDAPTESQLSIAPEAGEVRESTVEATWDMRLTGVALFDRATGVMTERVWAASGTPTAASTGLVGPYLNLGRLGLLGADDKPDVGPSQQVGWPGQPIAGLPPWAELDL